MIGSRVLEEEGPARYNKATAFSIALASMPFLSLLLGNPIASPCAAQEVQYIDVETQVDGNVQHWCQRGACRVCATRRHLPHHALEALGHVTCSHIYISIAVSIHNKPLLFTILSNKGSTVLHVQLTKLRVECYMRKSSSPITWHVREAESLELGKDRQGKEHKKSLMKGIGKSARHPVTIARHCNK